jgi:hypothetical protein
LRTLFLGFCSIAVLATACSTSPSTADAGSAVFIATAADFSGFHGWSSTPGVGPPGAPNPAEATDGGIHVGEMTTYINKKPPPGSTSFPVGTIIVKEEDAPPLAQRQVFAMVKRGGGYNTSGAVDWEWFELLNVDQNTVQIIWQAVPVASEPYASNPMVCNNCHVMARSNDFVWTAGLSLTSL